LDVEAEGDAEVATGVFEAVGLGRAQYTQVAERGLCAGLVECSVFLVADALGATRVLNTPQEEPA
jgi:hypothetical protein